MPRLLCKEIYCFYGPDNQALCRLDLDSGRSGWRKHLAAGNYQLVTSGTELSQSATGELASCELPIAQVLTYGF